MAVDCDVEPDAAPVIVTAIGLPDPVSAALGLAENMIVLVVEFTDAKEAVTPLGRPVAERLTLLPLNPLMPVMVTVALAVPLWFSERPAAGDTLNPTNAGSSAVT